MAYLVVNGMIATGMAQCPGRLLLTDSSIYVLKEAVDLRTAGLLFGALGALVAAAVGRTAATRKPPPAYLSEPELAELSERDRRALMTTQVMVKYALSGLSVRPTTMGFLLDDGTIGTRYAGLVHKKKISAFLTGRNLAPGHQVQAAGGR
jgi:hypothetical protein